MKGTSFIVYLTPTSSSVADSVMATVNIAGMPPTYQDPTQDPFEVRVDAYSAAVGRAERFWYKPWTWRNSVYYVEKHSFNKFQDEEVPTQAKHREEKHPTGPKVDVEKDGKCWTEEPVEVFQYSTPYFVKMRWIEWWRVNKTLENFYGIAHDMEQAVNDIPDDAATAFKGVTRIAGASSPAPYGVNSAIAGGLTYAQGAARVVLAGDGALTVKETGVVAVGIVATGVGAAATGVASVAVPAIVGSAVIAGSYITFSKVREKEVKSAEMISEGWELVGHYYGKEVLERQAATTVMGPVHDCEHWAQPQPPVEEHWAQPQPQPRTGFDLGRWWIWFLGSLLALIVLVTGVALAQRSGNVAAGVPPTAMPSLLAHLVAPSTIYAVEFPGGAPAGETYQWIGAIGCGTFSPFSKTPTALRPGGSTATWTHPNAPLPPPDLSRSDADGDGVFDFCPHSEVPNFSHPGKITVIMTDGRGGDAYCTYDGSLEGTGQCHLGKP